LKEIGNNKFTKNGTIFSELNGGKRQLAMTYS
jgi:hypothetical protein